MRLLKNKKFKDFGLNHARFILLLKKFGLKNKKYINLVNDLKLIEQNIDDFLKINLFKKEHLLKILNFNKNKKIENGSYIGYKVSRGLPVHNQRTKTNSRTSRRTF